VHRQLDVTIQCGSDVCGKAGQFEAAFNTSSPGSFTATGAASPINVNGLANGTPYSFTVTATNSVGTGPASTASNSVMPNPVFTAQLQNGFNLIGNSTTMVLNVATVFGNVVDSDVTGVSAKIDAVWRWNSTTQKWQFYTPQLTVAQSAAYAASHNFEALTSVPPGEGYWISTYQAFTLDVAGGTGFDYGLISFGTRPQFWNLLSIGSTLTVQDFNCNVGEPPSPGQPCAANFESLWAWKATAPQKWYFHSPQLDGGVPFTNCQYAANNNYLCFDTPTLIQLGPGIGFWVYRP